MTSITLLLGPLPSSRNLYKSNKSPSGFPWNQELNAPLASERRTALQPLLRGHQGQQELGEQCPYPWCIPSPCLTCLSEEPPSTHPPICIPVAAGRAWPWGPLFSFLWAGSGQ